MRQPARRTGEALPQPPSATTPKTRTRAPSHRRTPATAHPPDPIRSSLSASRHHRGKPFGLTTGLQEHGLTLVGTQFSAGPASSPYDLYGPCSSVPASGCHHRPVPETMALKKTAAPGHGKLGRNSLCTLSGRSADNLEPNGTARTFPDALNLPTTEPPVNCYQPPTTHRPPASRPPLVSRQPAANDPPAAGPMK